MVVTADPAKNDRMFGNHDVMNVLTGSSFPASVLQHDLLRV